MVFLDSELSLTNDIIETSTFESPACIADLGKTNLAGGLVGNHFFHIWSTAMKSFGSLIKTSAFTAFSKDEPERSDDSATLLITTSICASHVSGISPL